MPEFNLRDVTAPGDFLLDMLKHRATKSLGEQFISGFNDRPGDYVSLSTFFFTSTSHGHMVKPVWRTWAFQ